MQRNLEQQTLTGAAGLGVVADDSGNTHLLKDRLAMPQPQPMCFLQPVQIAELQQPEPGGAVIVQAKKMPQAPEGAVRGGGIFPHHMQDQLQRKQQEAMLQQQQAQQQLQQQDGQLGPNAMAALMMPLGPGGTSLPQTTATPMPGPLGASLAALRGQLQQAQPWSQPMEGAPPYLGAPGMPPMPQNPNDASLAVLADYLQQQQHNQRQQAEAAASGGMVVPPQGSHLDLPGAQPPHGTNHSLELSCGSMDMPLTDLSLDLIGHSQSGVRASPMAQQMGASPMAQPGLPLPDGVSGSAVSTAGASTHEGQAVATAMAMAASQSGALVTQPGEGAPPPMTSKPEDFERPQRGGSIFASMKAGLAPGGPGLAPPNGGFAPSNMAPLANGGGAVPAAPPAAALQAAAVFAMPGTSAVAAATGPAAAAGPWPPSVSPTPGAAASTALVAAESAPRPPSAADKPLPPAAPPAPQPPLGAAAAPRAAAAEVARCSPALLSEAPLLASLETRLSDETFRQLLDLLPLAVFVKDAMGDVLFANKAGQEALGHDAAKAGQIQGSQVMPHSPTEDLPVQMFSSAAALPPLPPPSRRLRVSLMDSGLASRGELQMHHIPFFFQGVAAGSNGSTAHQAAALFVEQPS